MTVYKREGSPSDDQCHKAREHIGFCTLQFLNPPPTKPPKRKYCGECMYCELVNEGFAERIEILKTIKDKKVLVFPDPCMPTDFSCLYGKNVDIFDIVTIAGVYGISRPDPLYNSVCDLDEDGDIDIFDIVTAAGNYGQSV